MKHWGSVHARWYRDPTLPVPRTDITRFPHAVLEVKLSLRQGEEAPEWIKVRRAAVLYGCGKCYERRAHAW